LLSLQALASPLVLFCFCVVLHAWERAGQNARPQFLLLALLFMLLLLLLQLKRSTVVGTGGQSVYDDYRTSYGTFIK
jgi:hypothetical protein